MTESRSYAAVSWTEDDLLDLEVPLTEGVDMAASLADQGVTREQAAAWLERNAKYIQEDMTRRGWESIDTLLSLDNPLEDQ